MKNQYKKSSNIYIQLTDGSILNIDYLCKETQIKSDLDIRSHKLWQHDKSGLSTSGIEDRSLSKFKKKFSFKAK